MILVPHTKVGRMLTTLAEDLLVAESAIVSCEVGKGVITNRAGVVSAVINVYPEVSPFSVDCRCEVTSDN